MGHARARHAARTALVALLLGATGLLATLLPATPALAHTALVRTEPSDGAQLARPPSEVRLTFTGPVSAIGPGVRVLRTDGRRVDVAPVDGAAAPSSPAAHDLAVGLPADLPAGGYVVTWRVRSADGHAVTGALRFTVGDATPVRDEVLARLADADAPRWVEWSDRLARGGLMVALVAAAGAVSAAATIARTSTAVRAAARLGRSAALAGIAILPVSSALQASMAAGGWPDAPLRDLLPDGSTPVLVAQLLGLTLLLVLTSRVHRSRVHRSHVPSGDARDGGHLLEAGEVPTSRPTLPIRAGLIVGASLALLPLALEGHQRGVGGLLPLLDAVHLGAAATWSGAVLLLAVVVHSPDGAAESSTALARRVGRTAGLSFAIVGLAGVLQATFLLDGVTALRTTTYGRTLSLKVALVVLAVGVAFVARRRAHRSTQGWSRARRLLLVELMLLGAAVLATGALVTFAPPAGQAAVMFTTSAPLGDGLVLDVGVDALRPGRTELHLFVLEDGVLSTRPLDVVARLTSVRDGTGPLRVEPALIEPGHWFAALAPLPSGDWSLEVTVGLDPITAHTTTLIVPIP